MYYYKMYADAEWFEKAIPIATEYLAKFEDLLLIRTDDWSVMYKDRAEKRDDVGWKPLDFQSILEYMWKNSDEHNRRIYNPIGRPKFDNARISLAEEYLESKKKRVRTLGLPK